MKQNKGFSGIVNIVDDIPKLKDVNELSGFSRFTQIQESSILGETNINTPVSQNVESGDSSEFGLISFFDKCFWIALILILFFLPVLFEYYH